MVKSAARCSGEQLWSPGYALAPHQYAPWWCDGPLLTSPRPPTPSPGIAQSRRPTEKLPEVKLPVSTHGLLLDSSVGNARFLGKCPFVVCGGNTGVFTTPGLAFIPCENR